MIRHVLILGYAIVNVTGATDLTVALANGRERTDGLPPTGRGLGAPGAMLGAWLQDVPFLAIPGSGVGMLPTPAVRLADGRLEAAPHGLADLGCRQLAALDLLANRADDPVFRPDTPPPAPAFGARPPPPPPPLLPSRADDPVSRPDPPPGGAVVRGCHGVPPAS